MQRAHTRAPVNLMKRRVVPPEWEATVVRKRVKRDDAEVPELPVLPMDCLETIIRLVYTTAERLIDCLAMGLACRASRQLLDAVCDDDAIKRHVFLVALSERSVCELRRTLDFRCIREQQAIVAFDMAYLIRALLLRHVALSMSASSTVDLYRTGFLPLTRRVSQYCGEDGTTDDYVLDTFLEEAGLITDWSTDSALFYDTLLYDDTDDQFVTAIVSKAFCHVNAYLEATNSLSLVFRDTTRVIRHPYMGLLAASVVMLVPTQTRLFHTEEFSDQMAFMSV